MNTLEYCVNCIWLGQARTEHSTILYCKITNKVVTPHTRCPLKEDSY